LKINAFIGCRQQLKWPFSINVQRSSGGDSSGGKGGTHRRRSTLFWSMRHWSLDSFMLEATLQRKREMRRL
jgi:hypothetical protein